MTESCIAPNVARLRLDRELTQAELAQTAGLSRIAVGKIERGQVMPQARTLETLAKALEVPVRELVTPVRRLDSVRFRARKLVRAREQILAQVATWLDAYRALEDALDAAEPFEVRPSHPDPDASAVARDVRPKFGLEGDQPVQDICGLLEKYGVKVLLLDTRRDSFFGLSVGPVDGGPAVVVNTWDRISVERWIFTAAHELGRVLKVKRIFRVSYKTVLYRLVASERATNEVWSAFQLQHRRYFGDTLRKVDEPAALKETEFAWHWGRSEEPDRLSRHDFVEDRLSNLARRALQEGHISLGRGAEILGLSRDEMRQRIREWVN